jgi:hypothetical protein
MAAEEQEEKEHILGACNETRKYQSAIRRSPLSPTKPSTPVFVGLLQSLPS